MYNILINIREHCVGGFEGNVWLAWHQTLSLYLYHRAGLNRGKVPISQSECSKQIAEAAILLFSPLLLYRGEGWTASLIENMTAIKFNPRLKLAPIIWLDQPNGTPLLIPGLLPVLTTQNPVFLLCRISFFLLLKRERSGGWWLLFGSNNQDVYILLGSSFFHWWSLESQKVCMDICWSKTWFQTLVPCKVLCSVYGLC